MRENFHQVDVALNRFFIQTKIDTKWNFNQYIQVQISTWPYFTWLHIIMKLHTLDARIEKKS